MLIDSLRRATSGSSKGPNVFRPIRRFITVISIVGILVVLGAIVGGFLMEHGKLLVLFQPAEFVIIFGSAIGTVIAANPIPTLIRMLKGMIGILSANPYSKATYTENLKMLYELFSHARKNGSAQLEEAVDNPAKSPIFSKYPKFNLDSFNRGLSSPNDIRIVMRKI